MSKPFYTELIKVYQQGRKKFLDSFIPSLNDLIKNELIEVAKKGRRQASIPFVNGAQILDEYDELDEFDNCLDCMRSLFSLFPISNENIKIIDCRRDAADDDDLTLVVEFTV